MSNLGQMQDPKSFLRDQAIAFNTRLADDSRAKDADKMSATERWRVASERNRILEALMLEDAISKLPQSTRN